jgi:hypothetical protein
MTGDPARIIEIREGWDGQRSAGGFGVRLSRFVKLNLDEARFHKRGFRAGNKATAEHLEEIGRVFLNAANVALTAPAVSRMARYVEGVAPDFRGFAVEGATFGIALADGLDWAKNRLPDWFEAVDERHSYLSHVGLGWTLARLPWRKSRIEPLLDPLHHWLVEDGIGFHDCYFKSSRVLRGWRRRRRGYAVNAYDQGVGRALWFVSGGRFDAALELVGRLAVARRGDLLSGLGLAIVYAGGTAREQLLASLSRLSAPDHQAVAQGAAFAAEAMVRAGHVPERCNDLHDALTGCSVRQASLLVRRCRSAVLSTQATGKGVPPYEVWRRQIQDALHPIKRRTTE